MTTRPGSPPDSWDLCIERLYDAVGREEVLARALGDLRPFFGARGVTFLTIPDSRHPQTLHIGASGVAEQSLIEYHAHFNAYDAWALAVPSRADFRAGALYAGNLLVPPEQLRSGYFWNEFLVRYGVVDILSAVVEMSSDAGPTTVLTFHRHEGQPLYTAADLPQLALLLPHLQRVLRLHRRLAPALALGATLMQLLQRLRVPMLFIAADGSLVEKNQAADELLAEPDPLLRLRAGRLELAVDGQWTEAAQMAAGLRQQQHPSLRLPLVNAGGRSAALEARQVDGSFVDGLTVGPSAAILTVEPLPAVKGDVLQRRYGFTPMEARVAQLLAAGESSADVAARLGVRMSTVRTHIRGALSKAGVARQSQLVSVVLQL